MRQSIAKIMAMGLLFALSACQRLHPEQPAPLSVERAAIRDAIPLSFGRAFAVTTNPQSPSLVYIWFERDDRSLVAVQVDHNEVISSTSIPRR